MKIRYIALHINAESDFDSKFELKFNLNNRFISNYLSRKVRPLNLVSSDSFNMLSIVATQSKTGPKECIINNSLQAYVPLDVSYYETADGANKYDYCLQLLEQGYILCNSFKEIQISQLASLHAEFRNNGYKNEWVHKKKRFKNYNIDVTLKCFFSADEFVLQLSVQDISSKEHLISGPLLRTEPNEHVFSKLFKDVYIQNGLLVVTEHFDSPKFTALLSDLLNKKFKFEIHNNGLSYDDSFVSVDDLIDNLK